jgi:AbrB family looped-hinge helix DNA binding protein
MVKTTIDRFGRVLIPKDMRSDLGLEPGDELGLQAIEGGVRLTILSEEAPVVRKGRALVFTGRRAGDIEGALREVREERLDLLAVPVRR